MLVIIILLIALLLLSGNSTYATQIKDWVKDKISDPNAKYYDFTKLMGTGHENEDKDIGLVFDD